MENAKCDDTKNSDRITKQNRNESEHSPNSRHPISIAHHSASGSLDKQISCRCTNYSRSFQYSGTFFLLKVLTTVSPLVRVILLATG